MGLILTEKMSPGEVEGVVNAARSAVQSAVTGLRAAEAGEAAVRSLREAADQLAELGREYLGRRPELTNHTTAAAIQVRALAHNLYGDHARADEIIALNPEIRRHLPLIPAGTELTVYDS